MTETGQLIHELQKIRREPCGCDRPRIEYINGRPFKSVPGGWRNPGGTILVLVTPDEKREWGL